MTNSDVQLFTIGTGMIFLKSNSLFLVTKTPLKSDDIKINPIGHGRTISRKTFLYAHVHRLINQHNQKIFYPRGPGQGG
jgi:xylulose-5-phosphate/fructose-6-phosphate phosphoketolase